ncbi:hypothetical protein LB572_29155 [Mesorhizobium sp. BH1-1-5]|uniref:hypothetical protein n=1 Tax=unclassified Mesorhizobium TaxID=325217 RepID=UPI00112AC99B|nr:MULTISPECIES: hypothetical protein [unclassified Mesorhizobium]MBZ9991169.1 hypothetical protein [Mesorhizobium sp. BH1-1-5]TPJ74679.1 hypothetical protein FJ471_01655 [Mesorhizobium sp. B2-7-1]
MDSFRDGQARSRPAKSAGAVKGTAGVAGKRSCEFSLRFGSAHQAPAGWRYEPSCCAGVDCYQAPPSDVKETKYGYQLSTGELIPYSDHRIKRSREYLHERKPGGDNKSLHSFCLYVPDHGM